ncbi:MAG: ATP-binding protein [Actinomycetota bacterium]
MNTFLFVLLAVVTIRSWRRRRTPGSVWVAAAFSSMALLAGLRYLTPRDGSFETAVWVQKLLLILLAAFPYFLYRFGRSMWSASGRLNTWATWLTGVVVGIAVFLPSASMPDMSWPWWFSAFVALLLAQWLALSAVTAFQLYKRAAGQPTVARRRMRLLSLASILLSLGLFSFALLSAARQAAVSTRLLELLAMGSGVLFFAGFAPPAVLRKIWRNKEEELLRKAQLGLMAANTAQDVGAQVLPYVAGTLGGWAAALVDDSGALLGAYAVGPETVRSALSGSHEQQMVQVPLSSGSLIIWTGSYAPFFGQEELAMLESFGVMVDLALARCELIEAQRVAAEDLVHTNDQLAEARDAAMESSRFKSEFVATMSHEIRTPINGVTGLTGLLLKTPLDDRQRSYAEGVKGAAEALLAIINDILDFSKIEASGLKPDFSNFQLCDVVNESVLMLAEAARSKGLDLEIELSDSLPRAVRGDSARLRQILLNLVSNAVKFTDTGSVRVRAGLVAGAGTGIQVNFEVEDSGIGIAAEDRKKLFEPFSQVDSSAVRRFGGTGLGLAISRRLVELLGGEIGVDSEPGRGSRFWFVLPFELSFDEAPEAGSDRAGSGGLAAPLGDAEPAPAAGSLGRVLVVEDNRINQMVAVAMVEQLGYAVDVASNGIEALEMVTQAPYSAVLMDCQMPGMDGYTATRQIRRLDGPVARVSVVAMTAAAMDGDREKCLEAGMDDYISKPIRPEVVRAALARWGKHGAAAPTR